MKTNLHVSSKGDFMILGNKTTEPREVSEDTMSFRGNNTTKKFMHRPTTQTKVMFSGGFSTTNDGTSHPMSKDNFP